MEGTVRGVEMWGTYRVSPSWRISAGYTQLHVSLNLKPGSNDIAGPDAAGKDPAHTWSVRTSFDLPYQTELDANLRHVSGLSDPLVPAYYAVDMRVGWRPRNNLDLAVVGKNLFGSHAEYGDVTTRSEFERSVFLTAAWNF
jgi:iron complex outermembrane receptor protein